MRCMITENFSYEEMTRSDTAKRLNIDNTPSEEVFWNMVELCQWMEEVRKLIGQPILVLSGYRSPKLNEMIGGSSTSAHTIGYAIDIRVSGWRAEELAEFIGRKMFIKRFDQVINEFDSWVHIGIKHAKHKPRRQRLKAEKVNGRTIYRRLNP